MTVHFSPASCNKSGPETLLQQRPALTAMRKDRTMADKPHIDIQTLRQLLTYDPATGQLMWLPRPREMFNNLRSFRAFNSAYAGREAFTTICGGYRTGAIMGRSVRAHRVAYAIYHGEWPAGEIDHINGDRTDNRISNLRDVDLQTNSMNRQVRSDNSSGVVGVSWLKQARKWRAYISIDGRPKSIGYFVNFNDACAARKAAEVAHGYHQNHGRAA